jgi:hypothetical protein
VEGILEEAFIRNWLWMEWSAVVARQPNHPPPHQRSSLNQSQLRRLRQKNKKRVGKGKLGSLRRTLRPSKPIPLLGVSGFSFSLSFSMNPQFVVLYELIDSFIIIVIVGCW